MKKTGRIIAAITALGLAGWFFYQPYHVMQQLQKAARDGDALALNQYIDFPALRENMRIQLTQKITSSMNTHKDNPFAGIGSAFAKAMVGPIVETILTPNAIAMMASGFRPLLTPRMEARSTEEVPAIPNSAEKANRLSKCTVPILVSIDLKRAQ